LRLFSAIKISNGLFFKAQIKQIYQNYLNSRYTYIPRINKQQALVLTQLEGKNENLLEHKLLFKVQ